MNKIKMYKRTSVHITLRAIPCTATYEAALTVEVWSLCSHSSTCTEAMRVLWNKFLYIEHEQQPIYKILNAKTDRVPGNRETKRSQKIY